MNDTQITVQGFVGGIVSLKQAGEADVATFRLGCTPRYFNRRTGQWVDAPTQWYTVKAWRGMARNVAGSLIKGDAVTVVGRLNVVAWTAQDGSERTSLEIEAISVGHDLRHGVTRLARNEKQQREEVVPAVEAAAPAEPLVTTEEQPDPVGDWRADPSAA
jgi:single-strand DNA-binding protein